MASRSRQALSPRNQPTDLCHSEVQPLHACPDSQGMWSRPNWTLVQQQLLHNQTGQPSVHALERSIWPEQGACRSGQLPAQPVTSRASALRANRWHQHHAPASALGQPLAHHARPKSASPKAAIQPATSPVGHKALVGVTSTAGLNINKRLAGKLVPSSISSVPSQSTYHPHPLRTVTGGLQPALSSPSRSRSGVAQAGSGLSPGAPSNYYQPPSPSCNHHRPRPTPQQQGPAG